MRGGSNHINGVWATATAVICRGSIHINGVWAEGDGRDSSRPYSHKGGGRCAMHDADWGDHASCIVSGASVEDDARHHGARPRDVCARKLAQEGYRGGSGCRSATTSGWCGGQTARGSRDFFHRQFGTALWWRFFKVHFYNAADGRILPGRAKNHDINGSGSMETAVAALYSAGAIDKL